MPEAFKITNLIATSTTETIADCVFDCLQEVYIQRYDTFIIMTDMFTSLAGYFNKMSNQIKPIKVQIKL